jgi:membrane protein
VHPVFRMSLLRNFWPLIKQTYKEWDRHQAPKLGAALAYYTVLALAPLLMVVLAVIGLALGKQAARGEIIGQLQSMLGHEGAQAIQTVITNANKPATGIVATVLGLITLFVGASGVFAELKDSLNRIWDIAPKEPGSFLGEIRSRFLSFGMVLAIGFLLLVSLVVSAGIAAVGKFAGGLMPLPPFVLEVVNFVVSLAFITVLFALIYRFLPDEQVAWADVGLGAVVTSLLFTTGKFLIGMYLGKAGVGSAYGAAGSLVIVLVWVYYSAQIFFFGAEFTHVYAVERGSLRDRPKETGAPVVTVPVAATLAEPAKEPTPRNASHAESRVIGWAAIAALGGLGWWRSKSRRGVQKNP